LFFSPIKKKKTPPHNPKNTTPPTPPPTPYRLPYRGFMQQAPDV